MVFFLMPDAVTALLLLLLPLLPTFSASSVAWSLAAAAVSSASFLLVSE